MRVRKRVTMMVVTVSAIFAVCWNTECVEYVLRYFASYQINPVKVSIINTLPLLNSAVNPYVYALLNKQFRERMKTLIWGSRVRVPRTRVTNKSHNMELFGRNQCQHSKTLREGESWLTDHILPFIFLTLYFAVINMFLFHLVTCLSLRWFITVFLGWYLTFWIGN